MDAIISSLYNPNSFDPYGYVLENPVNNTDPTGNYTCEDSMVFCGKTTTWSLILPDSVNVSLLTVGGGGEWGGQDVYNLYLKAFYDDSPKAWWWGGEKRHFTLTDFVSLLFYREGWGVLLEHGNEVDKASGLNGVDAKSASAVNALYGWCHNYNNTGPCLGGPNSIEGKLNWFARYSGSVTSTLTAVFTNGYSLEDQFERYENYGLNGNSMIVTKRFLTPPPLIVQGYWNLPIHYYSYAPYGWGNALPPNQKLIDWLNDNKDDPLKVAWYWGNYFIPTDGAGDPPIR